MTNNSKLSNQTVRVLQQERLKQLFKLKALDAIIGELLTERIILKDSVTNIENKMLYELKSQQKKK